MLSLFRSGQALGQGRAAKAPAPEASLGLRPGMETFQSERVRTLSEVCRRVLSGCDEILAYIDENRELASHVGVEALSAEMTGILEGRRLQDLQSALDYALAKNETAELTVENLSRLNRTERLLAEAHRRLAAVAGPLLPDPEVQSLRGLGQGTAGAPSGPSATMLLVVGAFLGGVLLMLLLSRD